MRFVPAAALLIGSAAILLAATAIRAHLLGSSSSPRALDEPRTFDPLSKPLGPHAANAIVIALGLATFLVPVAIVGRALESFDAGLIGFALVAVLLLSLATRARSLEENTQERSIAVPILVIAALYTFLALRYQMHDEHALFGHKSMVEQLRRGLYPIHLTPMPDHEARYHVGFDLLAGALARAFDLGSDLSIDLVTIGLALVISVAAAGIVEDAGEPRAAPFAAIAIHLGAGLAFLLLAGTPGRHPRCLLQYHHPTCGVELFPTPLLNVFQHPVSLGVPLWLALLLVARRVVLGGRERRSRWVFAAAIVALGPAVAIGQVVYAVLGVLSLLATGVWLTLTSERSRRADRASGVLALIAAFGLALALSRAQGGMLAPSSIIEPNVIVRRPVVGFPADVGVLEILRYHTINLGMGFVALPVFLFVFVRRRSFVGLGLLSFAIGGILVAQLFTYSRSWDIVKFPSASAFALTLCFVIVLDGPLVDRGFPVSYVRRTLRAGLLGSGLVAAVFLIFPLRPELRPYELGSFEPDPLVKRSIDALWANGYDAKTLVYAQSNIAQQLAVFGGVSVTTDDYDLQTQGIRGDLLARRRALAERIRATMDPKALEELRVSFVLLSREELDNLGAVARTALEGAGFEVSARTGDGDPRRERVLYRVLR
ncbi:MAG: hypothetical protein HYV07_12710 [Deltaproteobacteria bacterium]|nr:hypothetical protein [Deltaproteobacteria bacterium]